ncbi:MAG: hypothetical protein D6785_12465 [Planctomycetota bacterium]|nr:MAG: hypothetical protein D6785_12465 [Planctomycetota bacterium]
MQVIPHYCEKCHEKILPRDLERGKVLIYKNLYFCPKCIAQSKKLTKIQKKLAAKKERRETRKSQGKEKEGKRRKTGISSKTSQLSIPIMEGSDHELSGYGKWNGHPYSQGSSSLLSFLFLIFFLTILLFLLLFLRTSSTSKQKSRMVKQDPAEKLQHLEEINLSIQSGKVSNELIQELQKLSKEEWRQKENQDKVKDLLLRAKIEWGKKNWKKIKEKVEYWIGQEKFDKAQKLLLKSTWLASIPLESLKEEFQELKKRTNFLEEAFQAYRKLVKESKYWEQKKDWNKVYELWFHYPTRFQSTPWFALVEKKLKEIDRIREEEKKRQEEERKKKAEYERMVKTLKDYLQKGRYYRGYLYAKKIPDLLKGTEYEKKLKDWQEKILDLRKKAVKEGKIRPPDFPFTLSPLLKTKKTFQLSRWEHNGEILILENSSFRKGYFFLGNPRWQFYWAYFLARLSYGKVSVWVSSHRKALNGVKISLPSRWAGRPKQWHECLLIVDQGMAKLFFLDQDIQKPVMEQKLSPHYYGFLAFVLHGPSRIEIKNLRVDLLFELPKNLVSLNSAKEWITKDGDVWKWKKKELWAVNAGEKESRIFTKSQWENPFLSFELKGEGAEYGIYFRANPQKKHFGVQLPLSKYIVPGEWHSIELICRGKKLVLIHLSHPKKILFSLPLEGKGQVGFYVQKKGKIYLRKIFIQEVPSKK